MIDFSAAAETRAGLHEGWSHQEADGVWAVEETSVVAWPDADLAPGAMLEFDVMPCLIAPYRGVQRLWVRLGDGGRSARLDINRAGVFKLRLPMEAEAPSAGARKLVLYHPDGIRPSESGGVEDGRKLSLFFRRIALASDVPMPSPTQAAEIMARFESLGGTFQGCEFGLVQRQAGVEPLGLLRWAQMTAESLAVALEEGFDGAGTPDQTVLDRFTWPDGHQEYSVEDRRYLMRMHSWINVGDKPEWEVMAMMCRRITFLARKLIESFAEAQKIFVFKTGDRICTIAEIRRIHHAMRRYGPTTLLYVRPADEVHPAGSVRIVENGLLFGYIDHFNEEPDGGMRPLSYDVWLQICSRTVALV